MNEKELFEILKNTIIPDDPIFMDGCITVKNPKLYIDNLVREIKARKKGFAYEGALYNLEKILNEILNNDF